MNYITYGSGEAQIGIGVAAWDVNLNKFLGSDVGHSRGKRERGKVKC